MGFEPELQRRGASSFKVRRLNHSATEAPCVVVCVCVCVCVLERMRERQRDRDRQRQRQREQARAVGTMWSRS